MRVRLLTAAAAVTFCQGARVSEPFSFSNSGAILVNDRGSPTLPPPNGNPDFNPYHQSLAAISNRTALIGALDAQRGYVPPSLSNAGELDGQQLLRTATSIFPFDNGGRISSVAGTTSSAPGQVIDLGRNHDAVIPDQLNFQSASILPTELATSSHSGDVDSNTNGNSIPSLVNTGRIATSGHAASSVVVETEAGDGERPVAGATDSVVENWTITAPGGTMVIAPQFTKSPQAGQFATTRNPNASLELDSVDNYLADAIQTAGDEHGKNETYVALIDRLFSPVTGSIIGSIDLGGNNGRFKEDRVHKVGLIAGNPIPRGSNDALALNASSIIDGISAFGYGDDRLELTSGEKLGQVGATVNAESLDVASSLRRAQGGRAESGLARIAAGSEFMNNLVDNGILVLSRAENDSFRDDFAGTGLLEGNGAGTHLFNGRRYFSGTTANLSRQLTFNPQGAEAEVGLEEGSSLGLAHIEAGEQTIAKSEGEVGTLALGEDQLVIEQSSVTVLSDKIVSSDIVQTEGEGDIELGSDGTGFAGTGEVNGGTVSEIGTAQVVAADAQAPIFATEGSRFASPASPVQTLQQALERTYQTSPTLMAQRAQLRGLDSRVAVARADGNPQVTIGADFSQEMYTTRQLGTRGRGVSAGAEINQVVFAGGRIRNSVRAADTRVIAGRADLRATEGEVFTEAVGAYADLLRDREIRQFNLNQVEVLETNLNTTRRRFDVRDLTKTDVAQSEARLALARSDLATAEGRLQASEENFERVVGARAGVLEPLPPLPPLPPTPDHAVEAALSDNADLAAFVALARAAGYEVAATRGERWPTISVGGSSAYRNALGTADDAAGVPSGTLPNSATDVVAGFSVRFPLYQGGAASGRVRQAEEARTQLTEQAIAAERLAVASARAAFAIWRSSLTAIAANESAVASNEVALESVKIEQTVGARSILDVLNAEQELLDSQIALASARRDAYVAAFALLNIMGAAEAADLNLEVGPLYDPGVNYREYADMWSDWADGPRRTPESTRTVPEQVNSPLTRLSNGTPLESEKRP